MVRSTSDTAALEFRRALGAFPTGVTVVTTIEQNSRPRGFTANSFTSVSLSPPLVLVCIAKSALSANVFAESTHYAVSILSAGQRAVANIFASKSLEKFEQVKWQSAASGCPVIDGAAAWFDCEVANQIEAGDHIIIIGRVIGFGSNLAMPLGYCRANYVNFDPFREMSEPTAEEPRTSAILEYEGQLVLEALANGCLSLPAGQALGPAEDPTSLTGRLAILGLDAEIGFLYSVFHETRSLAKRVHIIYRGVLRSAPLARIIHPIDPPVAQTRVLA